MICGRLTSLWTEVCPSPGCTQHARPYPLTWVECFFNTSWHARSGVSARASARFAHGVGHALARVIAWRLSSERGAAAALVLLSVAKPRLITCTECGAVFPFHCDPCGHACMLDIQTAWIWTNPPLFCIVLDRELNWCATCRLHSGNSSRWSLLCTRISPPCRIPPYRKWQS